MIDENRAASPPAADPVVLAPAPVPAYLESLNPAQQAAVRHGEDDGLGSPLLIIAGAGTGKTNTLAHRVAHLIAGGCDPGRVLLLTFSRRAAEEMTRRANRILAELGARSGHFGGSIAALPWSGTFHSVGARLLREYAPSIGLDPGFSLHDREDSADLMNLVRHELGLSAKTKRFPLKRTCLGIYSAAVNTRRSLAEVLHSTFPWCADWEAELKRLFLAYVEAKQSQRVLDYDDLLLYWAQMATLPALALALGGRFDHVLVDEYQDTNRLQAEILRALKPDGRGLTVVGDDAQSIYAFRGATVRNILDFPELYDPPARLVSLERNYRSTQAILAAANGVIGLASEGFAKTLWTARASSRLPRLVSAKDDADQAGYVVEQTLARREAGAKLKHQAVLFRAAHHSARLEVELTRHRIPFVKFGGLRFLEAAHVKDVLALMRWSQNLRDRVSGFRSLQLLPGIGPKTAGRILEDLAAAPAARARLDAQPASHAAGDTWRDFAALVDSLGLPAAPWPASFEAACRWYESQLERLFEDARQRQLDIDQLARMAASYPSRERFLTELTLDPPEATSAQAGVPLLDEDYLILSTIHSAKGQEWKAVTILNVVDGCIPSDMATGTPAEIDEERRLLYVAMTRAKDELDLMLPQRFYLTHQPGFGDRHVYASRSRFIAHSLLPLFEQQSWPAPIPAPPGNADSRREAADLAARMRAMWR